MFCLNVGFAGSSPLQHLRVVAGNPQGGGREPPELAWHPCHTAVSRQAPARALGAGTEGCCEPAGGSLGDVVALRGVGAAGCDSAPRPRHCPAGRCPAGGGCCETPWGQCSGPGTLCRVGGLG